jgi:hypothetical protein
VEFAPSDDPAKGEEIMMRWLASVFAAPETEGQPGGAKHEDEG